MRQVTVKRLKLAPIGYPTFVHRNLGITQILSNGLAVITTHGTDVTDAKPLFRQFSNVVHFSPSWHHDLHYEEHGCYGRKTLYDSATVLKMARKTGEFSTDVLGILRPVLT
jgi:hypothetical protein